jgi:hypothetical protein
MSAAIARRMGSGSVGHALTMRFRSLVSNSVSNEHGRSGFPGVFGTIRQASNPQVAGSSPAGRNDLRRL